MMRIWNSDGGSAASLAEALHIQKDNIIRGSKTDCCVISVIGGGGKTSLLYCLSRELAADGFRVVLTTTTHMMIPETFPWTDSIDEAVRLLKEGPVLMAHGGYTNQLSNDHVECCPVLVTHGAHANQPSDDRLDSCPVHVAQGGYVEIASGVVGEIDEPSQKITPDKMEVSQKNASVILNAENEKEHRKYLTSDKCTALKDEEYAVLRREADIILVEADGSRQLPLKAEAAHEPVIKPDSDYVIAVVGVDAVGHPLCEVCHRPELVADHYGLPLDAKITEELVVELLVNPIIGQMKGMAASHSASDMQQQFRVLINKADDEKRRESAFHICRMLEEQGVVSAVSALRDRVAVIVLAAGEGKRFLRSQTVAHEAAENGKDHQEDIGNQRERGDQGNLGNQNNPRNQWKGLPANHALEQMDVTDDKSLSKLEQNVWGEPLYARLLRSMRELEARYGNEIIHEKILVTQGARQGLRLAAEADDFKVIINQHPERGISSSIKLGIDAVEDSEAYLFTVCDQPMLTSKTFYRLIEAYQYGGGSIAAVKTSGSCGSMQVRSQMESECGQVQRMTISEADIKAASQSEVESDIAHKTTEKSISGKKKNVGGSPNIFSSRFRNDFMALEGDAGGKRIIREHQEDTVYIDVPAEELFDVDTVEDLTLITQ